MRYRPVLLWECRRERSSCSMCVSSYRLWKVRNYQFLLLHSGSSYIENPSENTCKSRLLAKFLLPMITAHVHSVTRGQLRKRRSGVSSGNRTLSLIGHSGSFEVILIDVSRNPERGVVVIHNNVDLISGTANSSISSIPLRFDDSYPRNANNLHCQKLYSLAYIFAADGMGLSVSFSRYLHSFFCRGSEKRIFAAVECVSAVLDYPRSMILVPIVRGALRAYATFY